MNNFNWANYNNNISLFKKLSKFNKKNKFNYIIKIADFYYEDTAKLMIKRIKSESKLISINFK